MMSLKSKLDQAKIEAFRLSKEMKDLGLPKCLQMIAQKYGENSWPEFVKKNQKTFDEALQQGDDVLLYKPRFSASGLNVWFPNYEEAKEYLNTRGKGRKGLFLFPYKKTFFVCQSGHLENLELNPSDPDWEKIGFDWVKPLDPEAKTRLREKMIEARKKEMLGQ